MFNKFLWKSAILWRHISLHLCSIYTSVHGNVYKPVSHMHISVWQSYSASCIYEISCIGNLCSTWPSQLFSSFLDSKVLNSYHMSCMSYQLWYANFDSNAGEKVFSCLCTNTSSWLRGRASYQLCMNTSNYAIVLWIYTTDHSELWHRKKHISCYLLQYISLLSNSSFQK